MNVSAFDIFISFLFMLLILSIALVVFRKKHSALNVIFGVYAGVLSIQLIKLLLVVEGERSFSEILGFTASFFLVSSVIFFNKNNK